MELELGAPVRHGTFAIKKRLDLAEKYITFNNMRVLDIGCGNGAYTLDIARKADFVVGIDIEQERLKYAKKIVGEQALKNIELLLMSAEDLSFPDNYFDLVTMIEVIEHIPDQDKALQNVRRVLKSDGRLVIFAPNKFFPFETHGAWFRCKKIHHVIPFLSWLPNSIHSRFADARIYTPKEMTRLLKDNGFDVIIIDFMLPPLDNIGNRKIAESLKRILKILEKTRFKIFGVSLLAIAKVKDR